MHGGPAEHLVLDALLVVQLLLLLLHIELDDLGENLVDPAHQHGLLERVHFLALLGQQGQLPLDLHQLVLELLQVGHALPGEFAHSRVLLELLVVEQGAQVLVLFLLGLEDGFPEAICTLYISIARGVFLSRLTSDILELTSPYSVPSSFLCLRFSFNSNLRFFFSVTSYSGGGGILASSYSVSTVGCTSTCVEPGLRHQPKPVQEVLHPPGRHSPTGYPVLDSHQV